MNKEETKFENYGYSPMRDFFVEVQNEANKFGINALPIGISAVRLNKYWEITIEYSRNIPINILNKFIKCNKDTIKFYNEDYSESEFNSVYYKHYYGIFAVYTEESLKLLLDFLTHYNVNIPVYNKSSNIEGAVSCKEKSTVKCAYIVSEHPCYIITEKGKEFCDLGSYIIQNKDGSVFKLTKEEFEDRYEFDK